MSKKNETLIYKTETSARYVRTHSAFCSVEGGKPRASSRNCREACWGSAQPRAAAIASAEERTGKEATAPEAALLRSLVSKLLATRTFLFFSPQKKKKQNSF